MMSHLMFDVGIQMISLATNNCKQGNDNVPGRIYKHLFVCKNGLAKAARFLLLLWFTLSDQIASMTLPAIFNFIFHFRIVCMPFLVITCM